jgi:serine/threonine protein kinase
VTVKKGARDTVVATICGDGSGLPLYYIHDQQVIRRAIKGMNIELMLDYIDKVLAPHCPGSVLFLDRLASHLNVRVQKRLQDVGITPVYFPAKTATELSPLDNCFFHLFKDIFRKLDRSTPAAEQAYQCVRTSSILACWIEDI